MDDLEKKFFLIIKPNYFAFNVITEDSKILFDEEISHDDLEDDSISLTKFLDDKIFKVEKDLNFYIKDIYLIIKDKSSLNFNLSLTKNFRDTFYDNNNVLSEMSIIKESILKSNNDFQLIHMMISKFIIDKKNYSELPHQKNKKNLFLEIRLICLRTERLIQLKKTLSKYQINIKKIFNYEYVKSFKIKDLEHASLMANELDKGLNKKEINFAVKNPKNIGFFEKFFKFFS